MTELKCPFCQQELKELYNNGISVGFRCKNKNCSETNIMCGTKALWQELIRTRKALDVALCSLQDIAESNGDFITGASTPLDEHEYADMMLKEIKRQMKIKTALEQKDVK